MVIDLKKLVEQVEKNKSFKSKKEKKKSLKPIKVKSVSKKSQASVSIPNYKAPSILGDENRFFNKEMEDAKRSMFFS